MEGRTALTVPHLQGVVGGDEGGSSLAPRSGKGRDGDVAACDVTGLGLEPAEQCFGDNWGEKRGRFISLLLADA